MNRCIICSNVCDQYDGKPWISMNNQKYFDTHQSIVHYCSYLCFKNNRNSLPKDHWKNVINKEDFNCPLPVLPIQNKSFEYLSYNEYIELTDIEKENYESQKENHQQMNPDKIQFYEDLYEEEKRTYSLENDQSSDYVDSNDDY